MPGINTTTAEKLEQLSVQFQQLMSTNDREIELHVNDDCTDDECTALIACMHITAGYEALGVLVSNAPRDYSCVGLSLEQLPEIYKLLKYEYRKNNASGKFRNSDLIYHRRGDVRERERSLHLNLNDTDKKFLQLVGKLSLGVIMDKDALAIILQESENLQTKTKISRRF